MQDASPRLKMPTTVHASPLECHEQGAPGIASRRTARPIRNNRSASTRSRRRSGWQRVSREPRQSS